MDDEIHHFNRGVHDTEAFRHTREGVAEKLVIQFHHDALFACNRIDTGCAHADTLIEPVQGLCFLVQVVFLQNIQHAPCMALDTGFWLGKIGILKQRIKHRPGDQVLCQHLNHLLVRDAIVQIVTQLIGKRLERARLLSVGRIVDDRGDACDVCLGDVRDIRGPFFPIQPAATFVDQFGIDGPLDFTDLELNASNLHLHTL